MILREANKVRGQATVIKYLFHIRVFSKIDSKEGKRGTELRISTYHPFASKGLVGLQYYIYEWVGVIRRKVGPFKCTQVKGQGVNSSIVTFSEKRFE